MVHLLVVGVEVFVFASAAVAPVVAVVDASDGHHSFPVDGAVIGERDGEMVAESVFLVADDNVVGDAVFPVSVSVESSAAFGGFHCVSPSSTDLFELTEEFPE